MFLPGVLCGQTKPENPLTKAIQLFDKKNYTEAEIVFGELLAGRPGDFMINYFYGACRTENGHFSEADLQYLVTASKEVYPIDIDYYFGLQYHAKSIFDKALIHYNNFRKVAAPEEQVRVGLVAKIAQCEQRINPYVTENEATIQIVNDSLSTTATVQAELADTVEIIKADTAIIIEEHKVNQEVKKPVEQLINFNINSRFTYLYESNFKTSEGIGNFREASAKQNEMKQIELRTEILRDHYTNSASKAEKDSLGKLIIDLENDAYQLNLMVKQLFNQARIAEINYWQNASKTEEQQFIQELDAAALAIAESKVIENETPVTGILLSPLLVEVAPVDKPAKENLNPGITYKIQLGAWSKGIPNNLKPVMKKISMIRKVENYIDDNGVVVYTTGNLNNYDDALLMLSQVKQEGVKDAIIAAYRNGKRITLEPAKETE